MCLETADRKEITDKIKKSIGKDGIKVYKVVQLHSSKRYPLYQRTQTPFEVGINEAFITTRIKLGSYHAETYQSGFHFWLKRKDAKDGLRGSDRIRLKIIECIVKKSWITATGMNEMYYDTIEKKMMLGKTIVASKAIFPKEE